MGLSNGFWNKIVNISKFYGFNMKLKDLFLMLIGICMCCSGLYARSVLYKHYCNNSDESYCENCHRNRCVSLKEKCEGTNKERLKEKRRGQAIRAKQIADYYADPQVQREIGMGPIDGQWPGYFDYNVDPIYQQWYEIPPFVGITVYPQQWYGKPVDEPWRGCGFGKEFYC